MKIIQKYDECIGCGTCEAVCPKFWALVDEDMKYELKGATKNPETGFLELEVEDVECNKEASDVCPVQIIEIE